MVKEFDYPEFFLKDKMSLRLVIQALKKVLKDPFPIDYLYRIWKNTEGQVSTVFPFRVARSWTLLILVSLWHSSPGYCNR